MGGHERDSYRLQPFDTGNTPHQNEELFSVNGRTALEISSYYANSLSDLFGQKLQSSEKKQCLSRRFKQLPIRVVYLEDIKLVRV